MADPATYRPATGEIPTSPGVYRFYDQDDRVIYVGKAKSLRPRLSSYFQDLAGLHPRTQTMVQTAVRVEWTVVGTEVEALALEYTWIKEFSPRFNVRFRDDKSYPWLAVTVGERIPRVTVMRGEQKKNVRYFGPYTHAWAIRETVDTLLRVFPMRSCSTGVFRRAELSGRPCLLGDIGKCAAPCVGRVSEAEHREIVNGFLDFMAGNTKPVISRITNDMKAAAAAQEYERAAKYRDDLLALETALERQTVVFTDGTDADVFGFAADDLEVAVQIFSVRGGRIRGQRGWVAEREERMDLAEIIQRALMTLYADNASTAIPPLVLVPELPAEHTTLSHLLRQERGTRVSIRVPQRGDKRTLIETVERNAKELLNRHKIQRSGDLTNRSQALEDLQSALALPQPPLRIECYDISHTQGSCPVGSMVVFEDGLPKKAEYRSFSVRDQGNDDVASMKEVLTRRLTHLAETSSNSNREIAETDIEADAGVTEPRTSFHYRPSLLLIDGGAPQVNAAADVLSELSITDIAVCGLAKRLEEVWLPHDPDPLILSRSSQGLYLLQRVRDEAHRFALKQHRKQRAKSSIASSLDEIDGIGPKRRKDLLRHFGSVKALKAATVEELAEVPGIGPETARNIAAKLAAKYAQGTTVDTVTGEIIEETT